MCRNTKQWCVVSTPAALPHQLCSNPNHSPTGSTHSALLQIRTQAQVRIQIQFEKSNANTHTNTNKNTNTVPILQLQAIPVLAQPTAGALPLFLSTSLGGHYRTTTTASACLMLFSREEVGRQTMLAHSRVSLHPYQWTAIPSTTTTPSSDHQIITILPNHPQIAK